MLGAIDAKDQASTGFQNQSGGGQSAKCARVLIIEDDNDLAESLRDVLVLSDPDVTVEIARDGVTGVAAAKRLRPDLVICDIGLPEMDGYQVVRALRKQPTLAGVKILALTGYARAEDVQRCVEAGFSGHLAKPLTETQLSNLLQDNC
jgi:two-component system CheB/CheR fusion protein